MPTKPPYLNMIEFICVTCGHKHEVEVHDGMNVRIGDVIKPHPGGGKWGKCRMCGKPGLRAVTEQPLPKKRAVGWNKIPKK